MGHRHAVHRYSLYQHVIHDYDSRDPWAAEQYGTSGPQDHDGACIDPDARILLPDRECGRTGPCFFIVGGCIYRFLLHGIYSEHHIGVCKRCSGRAV